MSLLSVSASRSVLLASSVYFFICGISAVFFPVSWLWAAGLPGPMTTELHLAFGVIGAYLCAFGVGAYIASGHPGNHLGLILTLIAGNAFDFLVTLRAVTAGQLPVLNGTLFLVVAVVWATLLVLAWASERQASNR
jgi:hypothetical protein